MLKVSIYNQSGAKVGEHEIDAKIFGLKVNPAVVHQVLIAQMANARRVIADTKTRGEVSGGGKKPWKQKGTGRARHGSIRSPLWKGGGVVFGPRSDRNYSQKVNKKMKKKAILMCLSQKVAAEKLILLESLELSDGKTKTAAKMLKSLPVDEKKVLVGLPAVNKNVMAGVKNLEKVWATDAGSLNVRDLLKYEYLLTTIDGLKKITAVYAK
jgi:large subunit ribosomal protein L4